MEDEMDEEEDEGRDGEEEVGGGEEEVSVAVQFNKKWGWFSCVDTVSQTLRISWDEVFNKNVVEFFNVLSYAKDKVELEKWQMKEYQNKLKNKKSF
jgi:hypothetical protein